MRLRRTLPTVALASSLLVGGFGLPQSATSQELHLSFGDSDRYYYDDDRYDRYDRSDLAGDVLGAFLSGVVNYFGRSQNDVYLIRDRGIHERELPVVFYLARQAGVSPMMIADLRARGMSWSDITYRLGLSSDIYYIQANSYYGPYASYYQMPRSRWSTLRFSDDVVIGLVNTRFISDYYRTPVDQVFRLRSSGRDFTVMARDFYRPERHGKLRDWRRGTVAQRRDSTRRETVTRDERIVRRNRDEGTVTRRERTVERRETVDRPARRQTTERRETVDRPARRQTTERRADTTVAERRDRKETKAERRAERRQERREAKRERRDDRG